MLIAGASGEKSQFPDGLQSDHLSEQTVGHGVRVKGISDPTTYPVLAGDVGEVISSSYVVAIVPAASGLYKTITSISLNKGVWIIHSNASCDLSGSGLTSLTVSVAGVSTITDSLEAIGQQYRSSVVDTAVINKNLIPTARPITVTSDGTSIFLVGRMDYASVGTAKLSGIIYAVRIA